MGYSLAERLERDLTFVEALAADLKAYLLSDILYWSLSKPHPSPYILPKGTIGGLLLRLHRLTALEAHLSPEQRQRLSGASGQAEIEIDHWFVQAEEKVLREIKARLGAWQAYLGECAEEPYRYAPEYATQVEGRTIIDLLVDFAHNAVERETVAAIRAADATLQAITDPGSYVWNAETAAAFPAERFWWLYVTIQLEPEP